MPRPLIEQLSVGGQILIPLGDAESQELHRIVRTGEASLEDEVIATVQFVALRGADGVEVQSERVTPC